MINFYEVKIGIMSRKGNLDVKHSFVCKSEKTRIEINSHYLEKYSGFSVEVKNVEVIEEVAGNVIDKREEVFKLSEIDNLKREIDKLNSEKNTRFYIECSYDSFEKPVVDAYHIMLEKHKEYANSVKDLNNMIRSELYKKYTPFARSISTQVPINNADVMYKGIIYLNNPLF